MRDIPIITCFLTVAFVHAISCDEKVLKINLSHLLQIVLCSFKFGLFCTIIHIGI